MSLSERAKSLIGSPSVIVESHKICASDPYSESNSNGYLNFGTAENHLMSEELLAYINRPLSLTPEHIQYGENHGSQKLRESCLSFFEDFLNIPELVPENFTVQTGLSAVCETLSFCMFDERDLLMIPTPFYSGFDFDFRLRFKVKFLEVDLDPKKDFKHEIAPFKDSYEICREKERIKGILITHPNNPSGEVLSDGFIKDIVAFAKRNNLPLITDEIYALSNHKGDGHHSIFSEARKEGVCCHLLYGMAKDFSLAGFKVGFHYTDDIPLRDMMQALSYFHPVSSHTSELVANLLTDKDFLKSFIPLNQKKLAATKQKLSQGLSQLKFKSSSAGLFMLLDMSESCKTFTDEETLHKKLLIDHKVNFLRGADLGLKQPGYFRVCFSRHDSEINELITRLKDLR